jgi:hypothetical protein
MKKNITCLLLAVVLNHTIYAQGNAYSDLAKLGKLSKIQIDSGYIPYKSYFFNGEWVRAKILTSDNSVLSNDSFLYNFDIVNRTLMITTDLRNVFEIDHREFKAVVFYVRDSAYLFKHIDFINDKDLFKVLINSKEKYSLCKLIRTKITRASYALGLPSGNKPSPLDNYTDISMYYIFYPNKEYKKIFLLKKSAIEKMFRLDPDGQKVSDYLNQMGKNELDESDLIQMITYLNQ